MQFRCIFILSSKETLTIALGNEETRGQKFGALGPPALWREAVGLLTPGSFFYVHRPTWSGEQ